jgi:hypothetical protein
LLRWLGKWHILINHFPIALLTAAAALGWVHASAGGYGRSTSQFLALHASVGSAAAAWSLVVAGLARWDAYRGKRSWAFRVALWAGAALIGAAAHFGGSLVHGDDFLAW